MIQTVAGVLRLKIKDEEDISVPLAEQRVLFRISFPLLQHLEQIQRRRIRILKHLPVELMDVRPVGNDGKIQIQTVNLKQILKEFFLRLFPLHAEEDFLLTHQTHHS